MKKFFKILFVVIVVILAILISIPFIFKNKIIEKTKQEINNNLNAKVEFGDFSLSIFRSFPDLNFKINNFIIAGLNEFKDDTLLALNTLSTDIDLLSIFGDEIKIKAIILDQPRILAKVLKGGKANWDIIIESEEEAEADKVISEPTEFKLCLKKFLINNAEIIYDDKELDVYTRLSNFNFSLKGDLTQDFTTLYTTSIAEAFTVVYEGIKYINKAKLEVIIDLDADLVNSKYSFKENVIRLNELEFGFDGFVSMPEEDIDMNITFKTTKTDFKTLLSLIPAIYMKDFEDVKTSGKLALNGFAKGTYNDSILPAFDFTLLVENAMFKYPDLPGSAENINIDLNIRNSDGYEDNTIIDLKRFHIEFADAPFDAKMLIKTPVSDPQIDCYVKGKIDLAGMHNIVPLEDTELDGMITADVQFNGRLSSIENEQYEDFHATGQVALADFTYKSEDLPQGMTIKQASLLFTPQFLELISFDSKIGRSDVFLKGKIENFLAYTFRDELLKGSFNLSSGLFDVNEFLTEEEATAGDVGVEEDVELSVYEVPANIDFTLNSNFKKIIYDKIEIDNVNGNIEIRNSKVDLKNVKMNLLQGSMVMDGTYDTEDITKPSVDFDMKISDFDISETFKAFNTVQKLAPVAENCDGKFSCDMKFNSILNEQMEPELNTINSSGILKTKNIVITNSDVFNKIADALKMVQFKNINFNDIEIFFTIKDGKITLEPFETKFDNLKAMIGGTQGIDQSLNYIMNFEIPRSEFGGKANDVLNNLVSETVNKGVDIELGEIVNVNVLIGGTVPEPVIKLNLQEQAKDI